MIKQLSLKKDNKITLGCNKSPFLVYSVCVLTNVIMQGTFESQLLIANLAFDLNTFEMLINYYTVEL